MPYKRKMSRDDSFEENSILDVDGIPVAKKSKLKFRLKKVDDDKIKNELKIIGDQIATTSQYLRFLNAIMHYKKDKFEKKMDFDKNIS